MTYKLLNYKYNDKKRPLVRQIGLTLAGTPIHLLRAPREQRL